MHGSQASVARHVLSLPTTVLATRDPVHGVIVPASQVLLDVAAIQPDRVLLLDTYFMVVVFYGATVAEWRRAGYHEQPEHQAFRSVWVCPVHAYVDAPSDTARPNPHS